MSLRRSTRVSTRPTAATTATAAATTSASAPESAVSKKRPSSNQPADQTTKKAKTNQPVKTTKPTKPTTNSISNDTKTAITDFKVPDLPDVPITPKRKRAPANTTTKIPPLTPTPSLVKTLRTSSPSTISSQPQNGEPMTIDRPVDVHITNAPLVTPGGTKSLAYPPELGSDPSPSKSGLPRAIATTSTLLDKACAHLIKTDPRMKPLIEKDRCVEFSPEGLARAVDPFESLASGIMAQQISGAAAEAVKRKFVNLFTEGVDDDAGKSVFPTPSQVASTSIERLRLAGLSGRKAEYIQGLAEKFSTGELTNEMLMRASDEEVMEKLIAVRGLGKWSVEMFACFGLKRLDILSTGDLGVQRGMAHFFGKDVSKLKAKGGGKWKYMSEQDMLDKSAPFAPYRSLFMWYMWRVEDVNVSVMKST